MARTMFDEIVHQIEYEQRQAALMGAREFTARKQVCTKNKNGDAHYWVIDSDNKFMECKYCHRRKRAPQYSHHKWRNHEDCRFNSRRNGNENKR